MHPHSMLQHTGRLLAIVVSVALLLAACAGDQEGSQSEQSMEEAEPQVAEADEIPQPVIDGLMARFPDAEIQEWTREMEGETVVYDLEFTHAGHKFEADLKEDGTIHNWEEEIAANELPTPVRNAVEALYPRSTLVEIMAITEVTSGAEALQGYEVVLETADQEEVEVTLAPNGTILEDSGAERSD